MTLFTADAVGAPEPIPIEAVCQRIRVQQNDLSGALGSFKLYSSVTDATPQSFPGGSTVKFIRAGGFFAPGQAAPGYIAADSGSIEFKVSYDLED